MHTPLAPETLNQLHGAMTLLRQAPEVSRAGFVAISDHIGGFSGGFATAASRATSTRERLASSSGFGLDPLKADLRRVVREVNGVFEAMEGLVARKDELLTLLKELMRWAHGLEQEAFLPAMAEQIRIRGGEGLEVQTIASILDNLMTQARPLMQEILSASQEMMEIINHLARRIRVDLDASRHALTALRRNADAALKRMGTGLKELDQVCQHMETRADLVNDEVFAMVQSIQYDDITSQRLEHCLAAMDKILARLEQGDEGFRWSYLAGRIIVEQLEETGADLVTAIQSIHHHLTQVADQAVTQVREIGGARELAMGFRQEMGEIAFHVTTMLNLGIFGDTLSGELIRTLSRAENALFQAKRALSVLTMTAGRLEKLAASVKSQGHERLEILTSSILDLSHRLVREAPQRQEGLTQALNLLQDIGTAFSERASPRLLRTGSLLRRLPLATQQLESNTHDLMEEMVRTLGETQATNVQIMLLAAEMTFHGVMKKTLDRAGSRVETFLAALAVANPELLNGDWRLQSREFADLAEMYTMDSERRIHQAVLGEGELEDNGSGGGGFELF